MTGEVIDAALRRRALIRRGYAGGLIVLGIAALWTRMFGPNLVGLILLVAGALTTCITLSVELYAVALAAWGTTLGKLVGVLLGTMVGAASMALSSGIVNEATGLDPSNLPYAVTFMAPLTAGYLLMVLVAVIVVLGSVWFFVKTLGDAARLGYERARGIRGLWPDVELDGLRATAGIILLFAALVAWGVGERPYDWLLSKGASAFVYQFEFYSRDPCARVGERIRRLSDDAVAVARPGAGQAAFSLRTCSLADVAKSAIAAPRAAPAPSTP